MNKANESAQFRGNFNFSIVDIQVGETLQFARDETITAQVVSNKKILFEDVEMSLSAAALTLVHREGLKWSTIAGPNFWTYDGEILSERRNRLEREEAEQDED